MADVPARAGRQSISVVGVEPATVVAGSWTTVRLRIRVEAVLSTGGAVLVELPRSWYTARQSYAKAVHATEPALPNFVQAQLIKAAEPVVLTCHVEDEQTSEPVLAARPGIDGRRARYCYIASISADRDLSPGDEFDVVFGDTSGGSPGFAAPRFVNASERPVVAVRSGDETRVLPATELPTIRVVPAPAHEILAFAPSVMRSTEGGELHVVAVDCHGNPVALAAEPTVTVHSGAGIALDSCVLRTDAGIQWASVPFVISEPGVVRFDVRVGDLATISNPIDCRAEEVSLRLYWGDLHSHAQDSFDAIGAKPYEYARFVSTLDFYGLTEHCEYVDDATWTSLVSRSETWNDEHNFVAFPAYEATFGSPWGHHNVFFRSADDAVPPVGAHNGSLPSLWDSVRSKCAFTIPHHTGITFSNDVAGEHDPAPNPDWSHHDAALRPLIEVYSAHGSSERYDPSDPLAYDNCDHSISASVDGPYYAWDAWSAALRLGVIGSSDDHMGQPGRGEYGLAAVWAAGRTRADIFDALMQSQCYATTGSRMILEFAFLGDDADGFPRFRIRALGTGEIDEVELLAFDRGVTEPVLVSAWRPHAWDFSVDIADAGGSSRLMWYVRMSQSNTYRGRPVRAWSSPIWASRSGVANAALPGKE